MNLLMVFHLFHLFHNIHDLRILWTSSFVFFLNFASENDGKSKKLM